MPFARSVLGVCWLVMADGDVGIEVGLVGDESELFGRYSERLWHAVRAEAHGPDALVDGACQRAWARLIARSAEVDRTTVFPWLRTIAIREVAHVSELERRGLDLDEALAPTPPGFVPITTLRGGERTYRYEEVAKVTGETRETVEQRLDRARGAVRELDPQKRDRGREHDRPSLAQRLRGAGRDDLDRGIGR